MVTILRLRHAIAFCITLVVATLANAQEFVKPTEMMRRVGLPFAQLQYGPLKGACVVDTGAAGTFVFGGEELLSASSGTWEVSQFTQVRLISGTASGKQVRNITLGAFGQTSSPGTLFLWEVSKEQGGQPPTGLVGGIGVPLLKPLVFRVNLRQSQCQLADLAILESDKFKPHKLTINPFNRVSTDVQLPPHGHSYDFSLDSGAVSCLQCTRTLIDQLQRYGVLKQVGVQTIRAGGQRQVNLYLLQSIRISDLEFLDVPVIESSAYAVGMGLLSHFDTVLDFPGKKVWLKPLSDEWPKRVPPDASGLLLMYMDENDLKIDVVEEGGAAAKAGLLVEDRILVCDGKEPKDWSMLDLRERLSQGGTKLPLRIRRGDKEFDLILPLEWQFEYPPKWPPRDQQLEEFDKFLKEQREKEKAGSKQ